MSQVSEPELFKALLCSAIDYAIISLDSRGSVVFWSTGAEALLGWTFEEMIGQCGSVIFTPEDRERNLPELEIEAARKDGRAEDERWHVRKDGSRFWASGVLMPLKDGALPGFVKIVRDRTEARRAAQALRQSELRFRTLVENIPQLVWRSRPLGERTWGSPQWRIFAGQSMEQSVGHGWLDAVHPDDRQPTLEAWHEAERSGSLYVEHRTRRAADGKYRWFQTRGVRLKGENSHDAEWFGTSTDVHDLRRAVERQQVLVRELHHRTRNLLGVVNAIAHQTLTRSQSLEEFSERFDGRIAALARVQTLVSRENSPELELHELVQSEIMAHVPETDGRIRIEGPAVTLDEKVGETLTLALHELATNAVKYGALAGANGLLSINWSIDPASLTLEWRESGYQGPAAKPGRGYGRELIEVALPFALGATTRYEVAQNSVYCLIELPQHEWSARPRSQPRVSG